MRERERVREVWTDWTRPGGPHLSQWDGQIPERVKDGGGEAAVGAGDAAFKLSHKQI